MSLKEYFAKKEKDTATLRRKKLWWETASARAKTGTFVVLIVGELMLLLALARSYGLIHGVIPGDKVALVNYDKPVTMAYTQRVIDALDRIKEDKSYKALLFVMNSPGGSPSASEELSEYLKDFNKSKPTYMYIQEIGASGGYYIASAIKPLYANPNAIVGSIGVILPHFALEKLAQTIGVQEDDLTMGKYKKPISYIKRLTEEQKAYLKRQMLEPTYQNFLKAVSRNRGVALETIKRFAEGKIYIASMPEIKGVLVDKITALHKLKEQIKERFGKKIRFVNPMPPAPPRLFGEKVRFDVNLKAPQLHESLR